MRTLRSLVLSTICFIPCISVATDVEYELNARDVSEFNEEIAIQPFSIEVKNREWVEKGIEEASRTGKPKSVFKEMPRAIRVEPAPDAPRVSYLMQSYKIVPCDAPRFVNEEFWPRTREFYELGPEEEPYSAQASRRVTFVYEGMLMHWD